MQKEKQHFIILNKAIERWDLAYAVKDLSEKYGFAYRKSDDTDEYMISDGTDRHLFLSYATSYDAKVLADILSEDNNYLIRLYEFQHLTDSGRMIQLSYIYDDSDEGNSDIKRSILDSLNSSLDFHRLINSDTDIIVPDWYSGLIEDEACPYYSGTWGEIHDHVTKENRLDFYDEIYIVDFSKTDDIHKASLATLLFDLGMYAERENRNRSLMSKLFKYSCLLDDEIIYRIKDYLGISNEAPHSYRKDI